MVGSIIVMEPTEFNDWLSGNVNQQSAAASGQQLYQTLGCASCHGGNGEGGRGPALLGVFNSNVQLGNGQTVRADEGYIRESILNPGAKLVNGFGPMSPNVSGCSKRGANRAVDELYQVAQLTTGWCSRSGSTTSARNCQTSRPRAGEVSVNRLIQWKNSKYHRHQRLIISTPSMA